MQLKRDTDYAVRIMVCMAESLQENEDKKGMTAAEIIATTGIPRASFFRICGYLEEHQLLRKVTEADGEIWIYPGRDFWDQSLFSISEAVEGNMQIFVIFGRNSHLLKKYGKQFEQVQEKVSESLAEITLKSIVNVNG